MILGFETILFFEALKLDMETRRIKCKVLKASTSIYLFVRRLRVCKDVQLNLILDRLKTYITLSFTYHFDIPNDTV